MATNPFAGIITAELKTLFTNAIDSLLETTALTRPCTIVYAGTKSSLCPNCEFDPISGKSTNRYKSGGPVLFPNGQPCPVCNSDGRIITESTETLYLMVIWDTNSWLNALGKQGFNSISASRTVQTGDMYVQTLSKVSTTFTKIKKAKEIIMDTDMDDYTQSRYTIEGDPEVCGFGNATYILTTWRKSG